MKSNCILKFAVIIFFSCLPSFAATAVQTKVKGVGVAPITKDQATAQRVALQLAKRDAVERAVGAEVSAESIPAQELSRVVATSSGRLQYSVVSEGAEGKVYIVEIEATVEIPPELESRYPKSASEETTGYKALVQEFPHGTLNWRDGYILVRGTAKKSGNDAMAVAKARRAAQLDAYGLALQIISGINFDPEETAKQRINKAPTLEYRLKGLIRGAELVEEKSLDKDTYQVTIKVPIRGIKGVQQAFLDTMDYKDPGAPVREAREDDEVTGVVVDARGLGLNPALFPEIVDEEGNPVYSVDMVSAPSLSRRGMAAYVEAEKDDSGDGPRGAFIPGDKIYVKAVGLAPAAPGFSGYAPRPAAVKLFPFGKIKLFRLLAQAPPPRIVIRQGPRPVNTEAKKSTGPTKSRIVISSTATNQIRKADQSSGILRTARVVIITDSMIGGTEGRRRSPGGVPFPVFQ